MERGRAPAKNELWAHDQQQSNNLTTKTYARAITTLRLSNMNNPSNIVPLESQAQFQVIDVLDTTPIINRYSYRVGNLRNGTENSLTGERKLYKLFFTGEVDLSYYVVRTLGVIHSTPYNCAHKAEDRSR